MTRVKICGLSTEETLEAAIASGADFVGLNFVAASPRHVAPARAAALARQARGRTGIVALFADPEDAALHETVAAVQPDLIQLHGAESPARVAAVRAACGLPVIKAIGVATGADLAAAAAYVGVCDHLLLDAKPPPGAAYSGGHGAAFGWAILTGPAAPAWPFMLSGGLTPETVDEAIAQVRPWAVDVSSGVERAKGVKDPALIHAFVRAARDADARLSADAARGSGQA
jgi:phosphoribosylanthranilate isomerase